MQTSLQANYQGQNSHQHHHHHHHHHQQHLHHHLQQPHEKHLYYLSNEPAHDDDHELEDAPDDARHPSLMHHLAPGQDAAPCYGQYATHFASHGILHEERQVDEYEQVRIYNGQHNDEPLVYHYSSQAAAAIPESHLGHFGGLEQAHGPENLDHPSTLAYEPNSGQAPIDLSHQHETDAGAAAAPIQVYYDLSAASVTHAQQTADQVHGQVHRDAAGGPFVGDMNQPDAHHDHYSQLYSYATTASTTMIEPQAIQHDETYAPTQHHHHHQNHIDTYNLTASPALRDHFGPAGEQQYHFASGNQDAHANLYHDSDKRYDEEDLAYRPTGGSGYHQLSHEPPAHAQYHSLQQSCHSHDNENFAGAHHRDAQHDQLEVHSPLAMPAPRPPEPPTSATANCVAPTPATGVRDRSHSTALSSGGGVDRGDRSSSTQCDYDEDDSDNNDGDDDQDDDLLDSDLESIDSQLTRDEKRAREANIPLSYHEIVNLSIEQFNEHIVRYPFSEAQLTLMKDIRRRGKNKVAAQTCRKRKMEQISELQCEVAQLANKRAALSCERARLSREHARLASEYERLYTSIQGHLAAQAGPESGDRHQQVVLARERSGGNLLVNVS